MRDFDKIWRIYEEAFPKSERRSIEQQKKIMKNENYSIKPIYKKKSLIGFYSLWNLGYFIYIEHFALDQMFRGKGYGSKIIKEIIKMYKSRIILEVERPQTIQAERRISFYQKLGFQLNFFNYEQPSYQNNDQLIPMWIMSYPNSLTEEEYEKIRNILYRKIYSC